MKKKNALIIIGMILVLIGAFLPSIRIAQENISFIKENGAITLVLVASIFILLLLNRKKITIIPSGLSLYIIIKFIIDNKARLNEIREIYNCYAAYQFGLFVMILGNLLIIISLLVEIVKEIKIELKETIKNYKARIIEITNNTKEKIKENNIIKNIKNISINKKISHETTKDGKIKFNKITVKCDKPKRKYSIKEFIEEIKIKRIQRKIQKKKLTISKYKDEEIQKETNNTVYNVPVIDIQKWTSEDICCSNCGATVHTTSEYCFLCDCKIKLKNETKQAS